MITSIAAPKAIFAMLTFKSLDDPEYGRRFFEILKKHGAGILDPEFVNQKKRFEPDRVDSPARLWHQDTAISLDRKTPFKVWGMMTIVDEPIRQLVPSNFYMSIDTAYFATPSRLLDLLAAGDGLYSLFSACYGALYTKWTPIMGGLADIDRDGLPGLGWVTWLGPEYNEIVRVSARPEFDVMKMPDGGSRILLPLPDRVDDPGPVVLRAYELLLEEVGSDALQMPQGPTRTKPLLEAIEDSATTRRLTAQRTVRVPKFRFLE